MSEWHGAVYDLVRERVTRYLDGRNRVVGISGPGQPTLYISQGIGPRGNIRE